MTTRFFTTAVAFVIAAASASVAGAAEDTLTVKAKKVPPHSFVKLVSYADLDLSSRVGVETLTARVKAAARKGCWEILRGDASYATFMERRTCRRASVAAAMPQIDRAVRLASLGQPGDSISIAASR